MNLSTQRIKDAYPSLVTTEDLSGFSGATATKIYDGLGNPSAISISESTLNIEGSVEINGSPIINSEGKWVGDPTGLVGPTGANGATGQKGDTGERGATGPGFTTIATPASGRVLVSDGTSNSAVASPTLTYMNSVLNTPVVKFDTTYNGPGAVGQLQWNDTDGTLEFQLKGGNTTLQIGQEQVVRVRNTSGSPMTDGQVVYISDVTGDIPVVSLASNTTATADKVIGMVTEPIAVNGFGFVTTFGQVRGINTNGIAPNTILWLGATPGTFTTTEPVAPAAKVVIGYVIKSNASTGSAFISIANGGRLSDISDVQNYNPNTLEQGSILLWNPTVKRWEITNSAEAKWRVIIKVVNNVFDSVVSVKDPNGTEVDTSDWVLDFLADPDRGLLIGLASTPYAGMSIYNAECQATNGTNIVSASFIGGDPNHMNYIQNPAVSFYSFQKMTATNIGYPTTGTAYIRLTFNLVDDWRNQIPS